MSVLQKVIFSPPSKEDFSNLHLLVEAGHQSISFYWYEVSPYRPEGAVVFSFSEKRTEEKLAADLRSLFKNEASLNKKNKSVSFFYNVPESLLIPDSFFDESSARDSLELIFGEASEEVVRTDEVAGKKMMNVYRVPKTLDDILSGSIRDFEPRHSHAVLIENLELTTDNSIRCTVFPNEFRAIVCFNGTLHMAQQFEYKTPADVIYFLLNICFQAAVSPSEVSLLMDGMIAPSSVLHNECLKFFANTRFIETGELVLPEKLSAYPPHYFNPSVSLAVCA